MTRAVIHPYTKLARVQFKKGGKKNRSQGHIVPIKKEHIHFTLILLVLCLTHKGGVLSQTQRQSPAWAHHGSHMKDGGIFTLTCIRNWLKRNYWLLMEHLCFVCILKYFHLLKRKKKWNRKKTKTNQTRHSHYKHITVNQKFRFLKKSSPQNAENLVDLHTCDAFQLHQFLYFSLFHSKSFSTKKKKSSSSLFKKLIYSIKLFPPDPTYILMKNKWLDEILTSKMLNILLEWDGDFFFS